MQVNPKGKEKGEYRVNRGCSYIIYARCCCVANRDYYSHKASDYNLGFRVIMGVKQDASKS